MQERRDLFFDIADKQYKIYADKNDDYGDSFNVLLEKFGPISFVTRTYDKMLRLEQLVKKEAKVKDETFKDTVSDMLNYCIMYLMWEEKEAKVK